jgi:hypothetical protein
MRLCEAMLGQDGMGYNPNSRFRADGLDRALNPLYRFDLCTRLDPGATGYDPNEIVNLRERKRYLDREKNVAYRLQDVFIWNIGPFNEGGAYPNAVISDVYLHPKIITADCADRGGEKVGMPVLYYKADPSKLTHDLDDPVNPDNIYDFLDNYALTALGCPWETSQTAATHPLYDDGSGVTGQLFYKLIQNDKVTATPKPHNEDTYILMSAGYDGLYGTRDDMYNFSD